MSKALEERSTLYCVIQSEIGESELRTHHQIGGVFPLSVGGDIGPRLNCRVSEIHCTDDGVRAAIDFCSYRRVEVLRGELRLPERVLIASEEV